MALTSASLNFTSKTAAEQWIEQLHGQYIVLSSKIADTGSWWVATVEFAVKDGALIHTQETGD